ncbi:hypothetical protein [Vibrio mediterranei]|uniref:Type I restriction endonuclease subunit M n=1 Tax=Vibrio mediterranei TaxID=689 RepID=A0ABX5D7Z9_9VIBR|nr:hypothetical protein [Vibrio mediterranei]MCG9659925.1 hypothetical protein [Vibrio mediterranei]PRQ65138.1 hypothetical protein COR51_23745 [Vibrio mediterranei]
MSSNFPLDGICAARFELGATMISCDAMCTLLSSDSDPGLLLQRHEQGDWGLVNDDVAIQNNEATHSGGQIVSSYQISEEVAVCVITNQERTITSVLLSNEF